MVKNPTSNVRMCHILYKNKGNFILFSEKKKWILGLRGIYKPIITAVSGLKGYGKFSLRPLGSAMFGATFKLVTRFSFFGKLKDDCV